MLLARVYRRGLSVFVAANFDGLDLRLHDGAQEIDVQKPVVEGGVHDLYPFGEDEVALKLTRGDPPVQKDPLFVIHLLAANDELLILNLDRQFIRPEPGDGKGDAQALLARLLHVVGGVAVAACLADSVEPALELIEAEHAEGWLSRCEDAGRFLVISEELVAALGPEIFRAAGPNRRPFFKGLRRPVIEMGKPGTVIKGAGPGRYTRMWQQ